MFPTGRTVVGKDFIDRKKHLPLFKSYIDNNQSIMIKAPRRFGKTSIVKHLLEDKKEYKFIYIDISIISNIKQLGDKVLNSAYALSNVDNFVHKAKTSLYELISSTEEIKASIPDMLDTSIKFTQKKDIDEVQYLLHSLDVLNEIALKKNINVKFAIDEFQDIVKLSSNDILKRIRSVIQHHENVTYIFLGSIESIMRDIFENKKSPFFHFAKIIDLPPLDVDELIEYAVDVFKKAKIKCNDLAEYISFLGGHPDYSMQFLSNVYVGALAYGGSADKKELKAYMIDTIYDNKAYIHELVGNAKQKKHHLEVLISIANKEKISLDGKSLYNARSSLEDMGLIKKVGFGEYVIIDLFLELYLSSDGFENIEILQSFTICQNFYSTV